MKVLFCSPYLDTSDVVSGGVNQWGRYIISYYRDFGKDNLELIPISLDRRLYLSSGDVSTWKRIICGIKEQGRAVLDARKMMLKEHPDVIHICTSAGFGLIKDLLLIRAAKQIGAKTVVHLHFGRIPDLIKKNNWEWKFMKKVLCQCNVAVAMNKPTMDALTSNGYSNVRYLPNPLSLSIINQVRNLEDSVTRVSRRILYVGHVARAKGVYELMEACCGIANISLRIVGKSLNADREKLLVMAEQSSNRNWVEFAGELSHDQVLKEFMEADIFAFPSYSEGFPNVILEAMACGCPIASSNVGAIPEMLDISKDACGVCYEPKDVLSVKKAIETLLNDEELKNSYSRKAKKRVNEMYAMPKVWQQLVNIWEEA